MHLCDSYTAKQANISLTGNNRLPAMEIRELYNTLPPSTLFTIDKCVGKGNFGDVFKAMNNVTKEVVAIKIINLDDSEEETFEIIKEMRLMSLLKSPYIARYITTINEDYLMWIVMEYCGGGSARDLIKTCYREGLAENKVAFVVKSVLLGLQYLHAQHKIHRDIKAANILLTDSGLVKVADFGVSAEMRSTMKAKTFVGTPYWMAPEVVMNEGMGYNEKSDIWSLGITTYELLKGVPPLAKYDAIRVMRNIPKRKPPKLHGAYTNLVKHFIATCLIKDPEKRPSASELLEHDFMVKGPGNVENLKNEVSYLKFTKETQAVARKKSRYDINEQGEIHDSENCASEQVDDRSPIFELSTKQPPYKKESWVAQEVMSPPELNESSEDPSPISPNILKEKDSGISKNQTETPITMESAPFKKDGEDKKNTDHTVERLVNGCNGLTPFELGSGMEIDPETDSKRLTYEQNNVECSSDEPYKNAVSDHPKSNEQNVPDKLVEYELLNNFVHVVSPSLKRMESRATDSTTKTYVNSLLDTFAALEEVIPGFCDVFMEEINSRMEMVREYVVHKP